ncbi:2Fe-2S iron-sulfur cluster-binding protein [Actinoplanes sp. NPDC024001]|uniref:2Fe-2S iron-sulfur cluster-binding protein n=1 Tax=Actinoplanes sp. NPDC024001 TaxID=3154598 RepID=UPI003405540E
MRVKPTIDGTPRQLDVEPHRTLADVLNGVPVACADGTCGACMVLADGDEIRSCLMLAVQSDGVRICTVRDLTPRRQDP